MSVEYLFVKPGLAVGGATIADILTAKALQEETDTRVRFLTGYCAPFAGSFIQRIGMAVEVEPALDRASATPVDVAAQTILSSSSADTRVIGSQFFSRKEAAMSGAMVTVANRLPTAVRMHNSVSPAAAENFAALPAATINLPLQVFMDASMRRLAPQCKTLVVPPIFDEERLHFTPEARQESAAAVRDTYSIRPDDLLFVQPTVMRSRKAPRTSLYLAAAVKELLNREVHFLIAGKATEEEIPELRELSMQLGVNCFLDGLHAKYRRSNRRIGELLCAANLATMPSLEDELMLSLPEAAYMRVPIFTRNFIDGEGNPIFDSIHYCIDCIVQRTFALKPPEKVVQAVGDVLTGKRVLDLEANAAYATKNFTKQGISSQLRKLHQMFNDRH